MEFDHIQEVARGGRATANSIRLRCRAHNQFGAECTFGKEFMRNKREESRRAAAEARARAETAAQAEARAQAEAAAKGRAAEEAELAKERDVIPWLRSLGFRADEAKRAAALCEAIPDAPLEERVRLALSHFSPRATCRRSSATSLGAGV
jgi:hypothetical protein